MKKGFHWAIFVWIVAGLYASAQDAREFPLRPVFKTGNTYRYVQSNLIRMRIPDVGMREMRMEQQFRFDALKRPKGKKGVQLRGLTERLVVRIRGANETIDYDSLKKEDRATPLGKHLQSGLVRKTKIDLNSDVEIVEVEAAGNSAITSPFPDYPIFGSMEMRQTIVLLLQNFTKKPVSQGETWSLEGYRDLDGGEKLNFTINYSHGGATLYEQIPSVLVSFSGEVSGESESAHFSNARLTGRLYFDPIAGAVRYIEQIISLQAELPNPANPEEVRIVPVEERVETRLLHIIPTIDRNAEKEG